MHGGGTAAKTFELARALVEAGASCTVIGPGAERWPTIAGVAVRGVRLLGSRYPWPRLGGRAARALCAQHDVVVLGSHWSILTALLSRAARALRVPYLCLPGGAIPVGGRSKMLKRFYALLAGDPMLRSAACCVAVNADEEDQLRRRGVDPRRIERIPNAVFSGEHQGGDAAAFRAAHGLPASPFVLFVGRLDPIKGPDLLLAAFLAVHRRFAEVDLVFAGPDQGMAPLLRRQIAAAEAADRVHLVGHLDASRRRDAYAACALLAIPSRREMMSLVALEAGAAGRPVLLTDACGFPEVVSCGGGWEVPATVAALTAGLAGALADLDGLAERGARLRRYVERQLDWSKVVPRYLEVLTRVRGARS